MTAAIVLAAGKGVRMGADKLWAEVAGRPVVAHSLLAFDRNPRVDELLVVIRPDRRNEFAALIKGLTKPVRLIEGGAERQDSVWNGLQAVSSAAELVAIHDAARPCVTEGLITATLDAAREHGAAVAAQHLIDTVKESTDGQVISAHLDRTRLWAVQTPQCFRVDVLRRAMGAVRERGIVITDDTAACALIGQEVRLVASEGPNPKVTVPSDLVLVEFLLGGWLAGSSFGGIVRL